jgi:hypothetical protein
LPAPSSSHSISKPTVRANWFFLRIPKGKKTSGRESSITLPTVQFWGKKMVRRKMSRLGHLAFHFSAMTIFLPFKVPGLQHEYGRISAAVVLPASSIKPPNLPLVVSIGFSPHPKTMKTLGCG